MKIKEIRELTPNELAARKREIKMELFHMRIQISPLLFVRR